VEIGRVQANHKKPTWRILKKSDSIIKWMFTRRMSKILQMYMKWAKVKMQIKQKMWNIFSARNLFEFCQWWQVSSWNFVFEMGTWRLWCGWPTYQRVHVWLMFFLNFTSMVKIQDQFSIYCISIITRKIWPWNVKLLRSPKGQIKWPNLSCMVAFIHYVLLTMFHFCNRQYRGPVPH